MTWMNTRQVGATTPPPPPTSSTSNNDDVTVCSDFSCGPIECEHPPPKRHVAWTTVFLTIVALLTIAGVVVCGVCRGVDACSSLRRQQPQPPTTTIFLTREQAITDLINTNSYMKNIEQQPLSSSGSRPEELALHWLIHRDPLQLNIGNDVDDYRLLQRYSLLTLWFQGDTGTTCTDSTNWLIADDECTWAGIGCDSQQQQPGVVTAIRFFSKGLQGSISPELGLLTDLTEFDIGRNDLTGSSLPTSIGQWSNLRLFNVRFCSLSGSLPTEMGAWTNLELLDVSLNSFTGTVPETIGNWKVIESANFCFNQFSGIIAQDICEATTEQGGQLFVDPELPCPTSCCSRCFD